LIRIKVHTQNKKIFPKATVKGAVCDIHIANSKINKTGSVGMKVTSRRFRVTTAAVEKYCVF
jgi:hypothetical protein